jgi:hypothetical protein
VVLADGGGGAPAMLRRGGPHEELGHITASWLVRLAGPGGAGIVLAAGEQSVGRRGCMGGARRRRLAARRRGPACQGARRVFEASV